MLTLFLLHYPARNISTYIPNQNYLNPFHTTHIHPKLTSSHHHHHFVGVLNLQHSTATLSTAWGPIRSLLHEFQSATRTSISRSPWETGRGSYRSSHINAPIASSKNADGVASAQKSALRDGRKNRSFEPDTKKSVLRVGHKKSVLRVEYNFSVLRNGYRNFRSLESDWQLCEVSAIFWWVERAFCMFSSRAK